MTFKTEASNLLYDGKIIFTAPADLKMKEDFCDRALIFYDGTTLIHILENLGDINHNILMIDKNGKILWRISNNAEKYSTFSSLYKIDGKWKAYLYAGYEYDLDLETGKISNPEYVR